MQYIGHLTGVSTLHDARVCIPCVACAAHSRVRVLEVPDVITVDIDMIDTQVKIGSADSTDTPLSLAAEG